jgi:nitrogen regulatory protein PII
MSYLVLLVLDDLNHSHDVLEAWEEAGAKGVTILESTGIGRVRRVGLRDDIPLMPSLSDLLKSDETRHRTLFTVVATEEQADRIMEGTQRVIGDLSLPNTGLAFVIRLQKVYGRF